MSQYIFTKRTVCIFVIFFCILPVGVYAAAQSSTTTQIPTPAILPTHPLYEPKLFLEKLQGFFKRTPEEKSSYALALAEKRLIELSALSGQLLSETSKKENASTVKGETTELPLSPVELPSFDQMRIESQKYIKDMRAALEEMIQLWRTAQNNNDVIQLACINENLLAARHLLQLTERNITDLDAAIAEKNTQRAYDEYVMIVVAKEQMERLVQNARQCISEEQIGTTQTETSIEPPEEELIPEKNQSDAPPVENSRVISSGSGPIQKGITRAASAYADTIQTIKENVGSLQNTKNIHALLAALTSHQSAFRALAPLVPPDINASLQASRKYIDETVVASITQAYTVDPKNAAVLERNLIGNLGAGAFNAALASSVVNSGPADESNDTSSEQAQNKNSAQPGHCPNSTLINGRCYNGVLSKDQNGIVVNGVPIHGLSQNTLSSNAWLKDDAYQNGVFTHEAAHASEVYHNELGSYTDHLRELQQADRQKEEIQSAHQLFIHWAAFSAIDNPTAAETLAELTTVSRLTHNASLQKIGKENPPAGAAFRMQFMDMNLRLITDATGQPLQISLPDILSSYEEQTVALETMLTDPKSGLSKPVILLVSKERLKQGLLHGAILHILKDETGEHEQIYIEKTISALGTQLKKTVEQIKTTDEEEYKKHEDFYKELENGFTSEIMQGLRQGIQQGLQQGIQQGLSQGLQQGLSQGLQQGLQQGMQQGLSQGLRQGVLLPGLSQRMQQATAGAQPLYENLYDYYVDPPATGSSYFDYISIEDDDFAGGDDFGGSDDFSGSDDFAGGDDFFGSGDPWGGGLDFSGGNDFSGGDDFFGGDDFGGGDDFSGGNFYAVIFPTPPALIQKVSQGLLPLGEDPTPTPTKTSKTTSSTPTVKPTSSAGTNEVLSPTSSQQNAGSATQGTLMPTQGTTTTATTSVPTGSSPTPTTISIQVTPVPTTAPSNPTAAPTLAAPTAAPQPTDVPAQVSTAPTTQPQVSPPTEPSPIMPSPGVQGAFTFSPWWIILWNFIQQ